MSPAGKAQQKAVAKYMKNNYDELKTRVPKGRKEVIQAAAQASGESLNGFVSTAIDERIARLEGSLEYESIGERITKTPADNMTRED